MLFYDMVYGVNFYFGYDVMQGVLICGNLGMGSLFMLVDLVNSLENGYLFVQGVGYFSYFVMCGVLFDLMIFDVVNFGIYKDRLVELLVVIGVMNFDVEVFCVVGGKLLFM